MRKAHTFVPRWKTAFAAFAALLAGGVAQAQTNFAQFQLAGGTPNPFYQVNDANAIFNGTPVVGPEARYGTFSSSTGNITLVTIPVNFTFQIANPYDTQRGSTPGTPISATLIGVAQVLNEGTGSGFTYQQTYKDFNFVIRTLGTDPILANANLLTFTGSNAPSTFGGLRPTGTTSGSLSASEGLGNPDTVGFSSDFLNFGGTTFRGASITFSSVIPNFTAGNNNASGTTTAAPYAVDQSNDYLKPLQTDGVGTFSFQGTITSQIPEPATGVLLLVATGVAFAFRRRS